MAEISLSAYQDELERLLQEHKYDEIIAHARHILKSQPKNLRAYQQLGAALVGARRWEEATDVLGRALGAQPQDYHTHAQLARAFQHLGGYERAIWHAERALDQKPGDQETIALVRELYRAHRNEEIDRLQLTAAALAQQQIRGNLLSEALDSLATALERHPNRIDLQLLRARAFWLDGRRMDAADTALDILERLPYVIEANRIMTELWLAEQRPSDAQLYLKRIEDLDPYLAHQMATGEEAPEDLLMLERLDYSGAAQREREIVNPEWLNTLGEARGENAEIADQSGGLGALLGIDGSEAAPAEEDVTADLDDLLSDEQIEQLFSDLVIGEPVAQVSQAQPQADEVQELLTSMEDKGFIEAPAPAVDPPEAPALVGDDDDGVIEFAAQVSAADDDAKAAEADDAPAALDGELTDLLEQLDSAEENGDWMADIQQGSLALDGADDSPEYLDDFEREWVKAGQEEEGGAPWLSAAMREAMDQQDGDLDLFGGDDQLQKLLSLDADTEPLHLSDIEDWLTAEPEDAAAEADERFLDVEDEMLQAPPGASWLDQDETTKDGALLSASDEQDPNRLNAELIDGWGAELDDDGDDPYVDWLRDDPNELNDEELGILSAPTDEGAAAAGPDSSTEERARAWGLDDADQLADFVEAAGAGEASPDWLNAVVPGLDRENDAPTDDANEYARPMSSPGKEFAWVNELVDEETGQMAAIEPDDLDSSPYFRFSNPPAWLTMMNERAGGEAGLGVVAGITALSLDQDIEALELDDLTFDDYFNFDTPTDKLDAISLDDDTQKLSFAGLDWDDYFDLESPTEKTIAITLDEEADDLDFNAIGVDDADFDFEKPAQAASDAEFSFDDIGLGDDLIASADQEAEAPPAWLNYDGLENDNRDADDPNRDRAGGQSTL